MDLSDFKYVRYEKEEATGIVQVTLNRPEIKNALSVLLLLELNVAVEAVAQDETVTAMILTGAKHPDQSDPTKEAFSSGAYLDLSELESLDEETKKEIDLTDIAQKRLCLKLWQVKKPVVAAINGMAIGGGFTIPLACADLIYVSEHAWAKLPFVNVGLAPELASSYLLPRSIGLQRTKEIVFFGEKLTARQLFELRLVNRVLPHEDLLPYTWEMVRKLIPPQGASLSVALCKEVMHRPLVEAVTKALDAENEALMKAFGSTDFMEALSARMEKREPVFKGC